MPSRIDQFFQDVGGRRFAVPVILLCVCAATVSWDRLAVVPTPGPDLKLAIVTGLLTWVTSWLPGPSRAERLRELPLLIVWFAIVAWLTLRSLAVPEVSVALTEVATVSAKIVILWGAVRVMRTKKILELVLTAFIWGGVLASIFGIYQLAAFYLKWPQFVSSVGTGGEGGAGRISAFNFEPAYFGYFLLLVIGAIYARARLTGRPVPIVSTVVIVVTVLLVNSRGAYLILPIVLVACAVWDQRVMVRKVQLLISGAGVVLAAVSVLVFPAAWSRVLGWIGTTLDPSEPTSNAVRLALYDGVLRVLEGDWLFGVGPGQFYFHARELNLPTAGDNPLDATANNNWLQALLDGGLLQAAFLVAIIAIVSFRYSVVASAATRTLALVWLAVLLIAGLFVYNLFDTTMLLVLALIVALDRFARDDSTPSTSRIATIGVDARTISTLSGKYMERMLDYMQSVDGVNRYTVFVETEGDWIPRQENFVAEVVPDAHRHSVRSQGFSRTFRKRKFDLVHFCTHQQPLFYYGRRIVTIEGLHFSRTRNPTRTSYIDRVKSYVDKSRMRLLIRRSAGVITSSHIVRQQVSVLAARNIDDIALIYLAAEAEDQKASGPQRMPFEKYLLSVGGARARNSIRDLISAHQQLRAHHPDLGLVLAGYPVNDARELVDDSTNTVGVKSIGPLSDSELDSMVRNASIYLAPTSGEGLEIWGLKAMAYGIPVASSDGNSLREVYGDAAEYFRPNDATSIGKAITLILDDVSRAEELSDVGRRRARLYSWQLVAALTQKVYRAVLDAKSIVIDESIKPFNTPRG